MSGPRIDKKGGNGFFLTSFASIRYDSIFEHVLCFSSNGLDKSFPERYIEVNVYWKIAEILSQG
jgi:hypothetical protein